MEGGELVPGIGGLIDCLRGRLGDFSALLTGSWARGDNRGLASDVDLIVFTDKKDPKVELCCINLPYECDLMLIEPSRVLSLLEGGFIALMEGLWYGKWVYRGSNAVTIEEAWRRFLKSHVVERRLGYWVVR